MKVKARRVRQLRSAWLCMASKQNALPVQAAEGPSLPVARPQCWLWLRANGGAASATSKQALKGKHTFVYGALGRGGDCVRGGGQDGKKARAVVGGGFTVLFLQVVLHVSWPSSRREGRLGSGTTGSQRPHQQEAHKVTVLRSSTGWALTWPVAATAIGWVGWEYGYWEAGGKTKRSDVRRGVALGILPRVAAWRKGR
jgi:hypothetical protein